MKRLRPDHELGCWRSDVGWRTAVIVFFVTLRTEGALPLADAQWSRWPLADAQWAVGRCPVDRARGMFPKLVSWDPMYSVNPPFSAFK